VVSHPIQYQVRLYQYLAAWTSVEPVVLFLSEHGLIESFDRGFGRSLKSDVPLTGWYKYARQQSVRYGITETASGIETAVKMILGQ
jgi:hypothetical protein